MRRGNLILMTLIAAMALSHTGCQFLPHSMQPSQMWKWNRQPAMDVSDHAEPASQPRRVGTDELSVELAAN